MEEGKISSDTATLYSSLVGISGVLSPVRQVHLAAMQSLTLSLDFNTFHETCQPW